MDTIWSGREEDLLGGVTELPAQAVKRPATLRGVCLLATFVVVMPLGVSALLAGGAGQALAFVLFLPVALLLLVAGIDSLASGRHYTFTAEAVQCRWRGWLGRREWEEPLSNYRGVLAYQRPRGENGITYVLTLKHRDRRARDILLYQSFSPAGVRPRQEHCARLLGVPAVTETGDGPVERAPGDLDKSVRQRVAEGSLKVTFDPASRPPGHGLALKIEGDSLVLRSHLGRLWTFLFASFLSLGLGAMLSGGVDMLHVLSAVEGWLHVLLLFAGAAGLGWRSLVVEELYVSPREVRRRLLFAGHTVSESALPSDKIEEVVLVVALSLQVGTRVQAVADSGTVSFGTMLSEVQRRWVRDCIIAVISK